MAAVADLARETEAHPHLPNGRDERFAGYGIMGLPFASGHVLAMRRFAASSVGPGYTSVWHRDPAGRWTFWQDQPPEQACSRYFSAALAETRRVPIDLAWTGPATLRLDVPDVGFSWTSTLRSSPVTSALKAVGRVLPERLWTSDAVLALLGPVAGAALRAGSVELTGTAPNGQHFVANPLRVWLVAHAAAALGDTDLGPIGPLDQQAALGDFHIPQRGIFAIGRAWFSGP